jgi:hypothetical protein
MEALVLHTPSAGTTSFSVVERGGERLLSLRCIYGER